MSAIKNNKFLDKKKKYVANKISKYIKSDNEPVFDVETIRGNPIMIKEIFDILGDVKVFLENEIEESTNDKDEDLTVEETAELFGVSPQAVYKWIRKGKIEWSEKGPGGGYKIPRNQFEGKFLTDEKMNQARHALGTDGRDIEILDRKELYGE